MTPSTPNRISVVRNDGLVPLLPGVAEGKKQPWKGILLESHSVRPMEIPEHEHRDICIHLQLTGDSDFEWWSEGHNRTEHTAPGSLIVLPPGTRDRLRWEGPSQRLLLSIDPVVIADLAEEMTGSRKINFAARWAMTDDGLRNVIREMKREAADGWTLGSLYADLLALGLQHHLLRRYSGKPYATSVLHGGLPMPQVRRAMEFMNDRLASDVQLSQIAAEVGISVFHFARSFKNATGQTPHQYLLERRMDEAKALLKETAHSVQEIALQCGFQSPVNFTRTFRERTGVTPKAWRAG